MKENILKEYLFVEWRNNVHPKYLRYFEVWYSNLLVSQKGFYYSWLEGYISPYH